MGNGHRSRQGAGMLIVLATFWILSGGAGRAEDFCVETDVLLGKSEEPALRTRTLFASDVVYDFLLADDGEIAVFDSKRGRFVLLDPRRKLQTTLTTEDILQFTAAVQAASQQADSPTFYQPDWSLSFDEETGWLTLAGDRIQYRAKGVPAEPSQDATAARRYREFADWYARLNAMRRGNVPPFARIELNKALMQRRLLPTEIERTVTSGTVARRKHIVRSRHLIHWRLSNTDRKRIQEVAEMQAQLPEIPFADYRQPLQPSDP